MKMKVYHTNLGRNKYIETAEIFLGTKKKKPPQSVFKQRVELIEKKHIARKENTNDDYKRIKRQVRRTIRKDKRTWLENECAKITEANKETKTKEIFKRIGNVKRNKTICFQNQSLKDSNCQTRTEMEQILIGRMNIEGPYLIAHRHLRRQSGSTTF